MNRTDILLNSLNVILQSKFDMVSELLFSLSQQSTVNVTKSPETNLLMLRVNDPFEVAFNAGEILVTTCELNVDGSNGYGMVMGDHEKASYLSAYVDAVRQSKNEKLKIEIAEILEPAWHVILNKRETERAMTAATKVNFQNMSKE